MIFDFSDKINKSGIKILFSNDELNDHLVKKKIFFNESDPLYKFEDDNRGKIYL